MNTELRERIKSVIETEPVALFMKGIAAVRHVRQLGARRCRRCARAGAPVTTVDVLPDPEIRQELSALSGWPTIPQVFIGGELVGGADIVEELAASGGARAEAQRVARATATATRPRSASSRCSRGVASQRRFARLSARARSRLCAPGQSTQRLVDGRPRVVLLVATPDLLVLLLRLAAVESDLIVRHQETYSAKSATPSTRVRALGLGRPAELRARGTTEDVARGRPLRRGDATPSSSFAFHVAPAVEARGSTMRRSTFSSGTAPSVYSGRGEHAE